jgi:uncharacterized lipoprotein YbaY
MKSIVPFLTVAVLATVALAGCNQNSPDNSTPAPAATNSITSDTNAAVAVITNLPDMNTNIPASTNK